jgi:hypothetical protein
MMALPTWTPSTLVNQVKKQEKMVATSRQRQTMEVKSHHRHQTMMVVQSWETMKEKSVGRLKNS